MLANAAGEQLIKGQPCRGHRLVVAVKAVGLDKPLKGRLCRCGLSGQRRARRLDG
jgi:hypothetical protein